MPRVWIRTPVVLFLAACVAIGAVVVAAMTMREAVRHSDQVVTEKALSLGQVERLGLELCPRIEDASLKVLESWRSLKQVDLQETAVTEAAVRKLQEERPDLHVVGGPFPAG